MYAVEAGAVVLEYTPNIEKFEYGNTNDVFENACVLPLNVMLLPVHVAVPVMLLPNPDLSFHVVTVVVEFMVELSDASNHKAHAGRSIGEKARLNAGVT
jgi:hypothetical protein